MRLEKVPFWQVSRLPGNLDRWHVSFLSFFFLIRFCFFRLDNTSHNSRCVLTHTTLAAFQSDFDVEYFQLDSTVVSSQTGPAECDVQTRSGCREDIFVKEWQTTFLWKNLATRKWIKKKFRFWLNPISWGHSLVLANFVLCSSYVPATTLLPKTKTELE